MAYGTVVSQPPKTAPRSFAIPKTALALVVAAAVAVIGAIQLFEIHPGVWVGGVESAALAPTSKLSGLNASGPVDVDGVPLYDVEKGSSCSGSNPVRCSGSRAFPSTKVCKGGACARCGDYNYIHETNFPVPVRSLECRWSAGANTISKLGFGSGRQVWTGPDEGECCQYKYKFGDWTHSDSCRPRPGAAQSASWGWGAWGACTIYGRQQRTQYKQADERCGGSPGRAQTESRSCGVDCVYHYEDWSSCSATCDDGSTQTSTLIITTAAIGTGSACPTTTLKTRKCSTAPCPVDCKYSCESPIKEWQDVWCAFALLTIAVAAGGSWGSCSERRRLGESEELSSSEKGFLSSGSFSGRTLGSHLSPPPPAPKCNKGVKTRTPIIYTTPAYGGRSCPSTDTAVCTLEPCPIPIDCVSSYRAFGACTETCGGGTKTKTLTVETAAEHGGTACPPTEVTEACNSDPCPIHCEGTYTAWGPCDESCGGGSKTKTLTITTHAQHGGTPCTDTVVTEHCNTQPCPIDCLGEYTDWSTCSTDCGGGTQTKRLVVSVPAE